MYAASVSSAAASAAGVQLVATDEVMAVQGTLGGAFPGLPAAIAPAVAAITGGPVSAPSFDMNALIKIALLIAAASWIGSAIFSGRSK
jgi:hypothetical protein